MTGPEAASTPGGAPPPPIVDEAQGSPDSGLERPGSASAPKPGAEEDIYIAVSGTVVEAPQSTRDAARVSSPAAERRAREEFERTMAYLDDLARVLRLRSTRRKRRRQ